MRMLEKFSFGKRLTKEEQKNVVGGGNGLDAGCRCTCEDGYTFMTYEFAFQNCPTGVYHSVCGGKANCKVPMPE